jgi:hypothetical protein
MRTINLSYYTSGRKLESELISLLLVLRLQEGEFMYSSCLHDGSEAAKLHILLHYQWCPADVDFEERQQWS